MAIEPTDEKADSFPLVERFACDGNPAFSDVGRVSAWVDSYDQALAYGRRLVAIGNWRSFRVVKEFFPTTDHIGPHSEGSDSTDQRPLS